MCLMYSCGSLASAASRRCLHRHAGACAGAAAGAQGARSPLAFPSLSALRNSEHRGDGAHAGPPAHADARADTSTHAVEGVRRHEPVVVVGAAAAL